MSNQAVDITGRMTLTEFKRRFNPEAAPAVKNTSGLRPLGVAVLLEPYESEIKTTLIEIPGPVRERMQLFQDRAVVIEAGPAAWADEDEPRAKPGDRVVISKFAGRLVQGTADGKPYRLVNDKDLICEITEEKSDG